jgi:hypothetical protein
LREFLRKLMGDNTMRRYYGMSLVIAGIVWIGPVAAQADETPGRVMNSERTPSSVLRLSDRSSTPAASSTSTAENPSAAAESPTGSRIGEGTTVDVQSGRPTAESVAEEKKIMGQLRGYQALLEREEKLLAQRMEYAAKLRQAGLEREDTQLLNKAEDYERRSMAAYLNAIKTFEKARFSQGVRQPSNDTGTVTRVPANNTPSSAGNSQARGDSQYRQSQPTRSNYNSRRSNSTRSYGRR